MITAFGSCRIPTVYNYQYSEYTHSTKEIIQILEWVNNINNLDSIYTPNINILNKNIYSQGDFINDIIHTKKIIEKSSIVIIEISTIKIARLDNLYLNYHYYQIWDTLGSTLDKAKRLNQTQKIREKTTQLAHKDKLDNTYIHNNINIYKQDSIELLEDLRYISKLLSWINSNIKLVFIPHINPKTNSDVIYSHLDAENLYLESRQLIYNTINYFIKGNIQDNRHYMFYPNDILGDNPDLIFKKDDNGLINNWAHYNKESINKLYMGFKLFIDNLVKR